MERLEENHAREQYFFDARTLKLLGDFMQQFERPCCLCAPMLGRELARRERPVTVLDVDRRFADVPGFIEWDIYRPRTLDRAFDVILCDPPFFRVSLSQLFRAIRELCHYDVGRRVAISWLVRRQHALIGSFAPFNLQPTGFHPTYQTVQKCEKNDIEFFANFQTGLMDLPATA